MSPEEFCKKWNVKRSQLAMLLGVSQVTVDHWFSKKSSRIAQPDTLRQLDEYDAILECWKLVRDIQETRFPLLYEIFTEFVDD